MYAFMHAVLRLLHAEHVNHGQFISITYIATLTPVLFLTALLAVAMTIALAVAIVQAVVHILAYASVPIVGYPKIFLRPVQRAFAIATMSVGMLASVNLTYTAHFRPCVATLSTLSRDPRVSIPASFQAATEYGIMCPMQTYPPAVGMRTLLRHPQPTSTARTT